MHIDATSITQFLEKRLKLVHARPVQDQRFLKLLNLVSTSKSTVRYITLKNKNVIQLYLNACIKLMHHQGIFHIRGGRAVVAGTVTAISKSTILLNNYSVHASSSTSFEPIHCLTKVVGGK